MVTLLIIGSIHALYLSIIVILKRKKVTPDYLLSTFLFTIFIVFATLYSSLKNNKPELQLYLIDISLLLAPLFFLYIRTITDPFYKFKWRYLFHFVLFLISSSYYEYIFNDLNEDQLAWLLSNKTPFFEKPFYFTVFQVIEFIIIPFYLIWSYILLRRHKEEISQHYSYHKNIDYKWLQNFIIIFALIWLATNGFIITNTHFELFTENEIILYGFSITSILIFFLGYLGLKQNTVFVLDRKRSGDDDKKNRAYANPGKLNTETPEKYQKTGLSIEDAEKYKSVLLKYVRDKKPYLNPTISLKIVADDVGIALHQMSQIINGQLGDNFYDFINKYRVDEFKIKIEKLEHKQYNLLSIALECGFNSKSAFNRVFKKFTNQTPSEYIKGK